MSDMRARSRGVLLPDGTYAPAPDDVPDQPIQERVSTPAPVYRDQWQESRDIDRLAYENLMKRLNEGYFAQIGRKSLSEMMGDAGQFYGVQRKRLSDLLWK